MSNLYIIAEAAQGYEGSVDISKLLVRSAKIAGASAIKFQLVFADDLAEPGYEYYELFKKLEMSDSNWLQVREYARELNIDFIIDVFGLNACRLIPLLDPDGIKLHSTSFFDDELIANVMKLNKNIYLSIGGIELDEMCEWIRHHQVQKSNFTILYGFQSEPTPIESNRLSRIIELRHQLNVPNIGFMDHSDGSSAYNIALSAVALGIGVRTFEKHITLDRTLKMEDYISGLGVSEFKEYVTVLDNLERAIGDSDLSLSNEELRYRNNALKRVIANGNLLPGHTLTLDDMRLNRTRHKTGVFKKSQLLGKVLKAPINESDPILECDVI